MDYSSWVFVPWNFIRFNLLQDGAAQYGVHPWYWYLTEGWTTLLGPHLLLIVCCVPALIIVMRREKTNENENENEKRQGKKQKTLSRIKPATLLLVLMLVAPTTILSRSAHKEFRFLHPLLPFALILLALLLHRLQQATQRLSQGSKGVRGSSSSSSSSMRGTRLLWQLVVLVCVANGIMMAVFGLVHQQGGLSVMSALKQLEVEEGNNATMHVLFLTRCHFTPWQSHWHQADWNAHWWDCSPPRQHSEEAAFHSHPLEMLEDYVGKRGLPTHVVMFAEGQPVEVTDWLREQGLSHPLWEGWNGWETNEHHVIILGQPPQKSKP